MRDMQPTNGYWKNTCFPSSASQYPFSMTRVRVPLPQWTSLRVGMFMAFDVRFKGKTPTGVFCANYKLCFFFLRMERTSVPLSCASKMFRAYWVTAFVVTWVWAHVHNQYSARFANHFSNICSFLFRALSANCCHWRWYCLFCSRFFLLRLSSPPSLLQFIVYFSNCTNRQQQWVTGEEQQQKMWNISRVESPYLPLKSTRESRSRNTK